MSAILDDRRLPFNPNSVSWGYRINTSTQDTLGGRVVQLLSTRVDSMSFEADAGNRSNLLSIYDHVGDVMDKQVETERPVKLTVPSRGWVFDVFVTGMPAMRFDVRTVTFGYRLDLEVYEDYGSISKVVTSKELERLSADIGYNEELFRWLGDADNPWDPSIEGIVEQGPSGERVIRSSGGYIPV